MSEGLAILMRDEEAKWAKRAKVKNIQEGGNNTKYFQLIANGKHRKKSIFQLEQDEGTIIGQENIKNYITVFYKSLFGKPDTNHVSLVETYTHDIPQISSEENEIRPTSQRRRSTRRSCRWKRTKHRDQMGSQLSSIRSVGILLKVTF